MEKKFEASSKAIKKNVNSRRDVWALIGDLFELYIPKIFSTLIGSASFTSRSQDKKLEGGE